MLGYKSIAFGAALAVGLVLAACGDTTEQKAATGGIGGAAAGAVVGGPVGAVVGGTVGAGAGTAASKADDQKVEKETQ